MAFPHRNNNRPATKYIMGDIDTKHNLQVIRWDYKRYGVRYRNFGPNYICYDDNNKLKYYWLNNNENINVEIDKWIIDQNIILSEKNNFEIPDEHKAEFKLRFH